jgi:outer membrane protein assembly factor BamD (BamD/ComL family)
LILAAVPRIRIPEIVILLIAITLPAIAQKRDEKSAAVDALYNQGVRSLQKGDLAAARAAFERRDTTRSAGYY